MRALISKCDANVMRQLPQLQSQNEKNNRPKAHRDIRTKPLYSKRKIDQESSVDAEKVI